MKKTIHVFQLFIAFFIFLNGCQRDEIQKEKLSSQEKEINVRQVSFNELLSTNLKFKKAYTKFNKKLREVNENSSQYRTNSDFNFTIDTAKVNEVKRGERVSYTMRIEREEDRIGEFENVVLRLDSTNQIEAFILKYTESPDFLGAQLSHGFDFKGTINVDEIDYNSLNIGARMIDEDCEDVFLTLCNGGTNGNCNANNPHIPGAICLDQYFHCIYSTYVGRDCPDDPGSGIIIDTAEGYHSSSSTAGSTTEEDNDDGIDTSPIPDEPNSAELMVKDILKCINPNQEQVDWLNEKKDEPLESPELVAITNYLNEKGCNEESEAFIGAAIDALDEGGEVDFEENIIFDQSFVNNQKVTCIYEILKQNSDFNNFIINTFGENNDLNLTFEIGDIPTGENGFAGLVEGTENYFDPNNGNVVLNLRIKLNSNYVTSASAISVARTILHESIHAYLILKHVNCNAGTPFDDIMEEIDNKNLEELLNYYYDTSCDGEEQHEFMFDHMIPTMKDILQDISDELIPTNHMQLAESQLFVDENNPSTYSDGSYVREIPWNWDTFYTYFSMAGLHRTDTFQWNIPPGSPEEFNFRIYAIEYGQNSFSKNCNN